MPKAARRMVLAATQQLPRVFGRLLKPNSERLKSRLSESEFRSAQGSLPEVFPDTSRRVQLQQTGNRAPKEHIGPTFFFWLQTQRSRFCAPRSTFRPKAHPRSIVKISRSVSVVCFCGRGQHRCAGTNSILFYPHASVRRKSWSPPHGSLDLDETKRSVPWRALNTHLEKIGLPRSRGRRAKGL